MAKNMPADALSGPYAQQQKMLLYVLPVVFAVGGVAFPLGVLIYWTTSNAWTMGQQFYVIRNNPAPGTPAFKAKQERDLKHGKNVAVDPLKDMPAEEAPKPPARQQPKNQPRSQRKKPPAPNPQAKKNPQDDAGPNNKPSAANPQGKKKPQGKSGPNQPKKGDAK